MLIVVLVLIAVPAGLLLYLDRSLNRIDALPDYPGRISDTPGTNWLIVGSDSRGDLSEEEQIALGTGGDTGGQQSDSILMVSIPRSGKASLISIPRDSYVEVPGYGTTKINAAYALGGAPLLTQTVEQATGVHIDHYAEIGFGGFAGLVDGIGGIELCLDQPVEDPDHGIFLPGGCQEYSGPLALDFVRERYGLPNSDLDRMDNQRQFLGALVDKTTSASTLANPIRWWDITRSIGGALTVDEDTHVWHLARLAWTMRSSPATTTVPIGGFADTASGNVLLWDDTLAPQFWQTIAAGRALPAELLTTGF